jgi:hypothetical protein
MSLGPSPANHPGGRPVLHGRLDFVAAIVGEALRALVQLVDCFLPGFSLRFSARAKGGLYLPWRTGPWLCENVIEAGVSLRPRQHPLPEGCRLPTNRAYHHRELAM